MVYAGYGQVLGYHSEFDWIVSNQNQIQKSSCALIVAAISAELSGM
jgi:hypothetical protein